MKRPDHNLPRVESLPLAPHRYLWTRKIDPVKDLANTYREAVAAAPYQPGDVLLTVYGDGYARAYVVAVYAERDGDGDLREYYEVRRETKSGEFAKRIYRIHPGYIQRAYKRAGQAPEMPESEA